MGLFKKTESGRTGLTPQRNARRRSNATADMAIASKPVL
jgi:hypothetical protein